MRNLETSPTPDDLSGEAANENTAKPKESSGGFKRRMTALIGATAMFAGGAMAQERPGQAPNRKSPAATELQTKKETTPKSIADFIKNSIPQEAQENARILKNLLDDKELEGKQTGNDLVSDKLSVFQFVIDDLPKEELKRRVENNPRLAENVKAARFLQKVSMAFREIRNATETWNNVIIWAKDRKQQPNPKTWETVTTDIAKQYAIIGECSAELQQIGIENLKKAVADINEK